MERRTRTPCLIVVIIMMALCGCLVAAAAGAVDWFTGWSFDCARTFGLGRERIEESFAVGVAPKLDVDLYAGSVHIQPGEPGTIQVVATKKVVLGSDLHRIKVKFDQEDGGLRIHVVQPKPQFLVNNASVDLLITAPPRSQVEVDTDFGDVEVSGLQTQVEVNTRAGSVNIRDIVGSIEASSDFGTIDVRGIVGPVRLENSAGNIVYEGTPQGECRLESWLGALVLRLPANPNVEVDADTDLGLVSLECPLSGRVTRNQIKGIIGSGERGRIRAVSRIGGIDLSCH
jgi:hypothetical protein